MGSSCEHILLILESVIITNKVGGIYLRFIRLFLRLFYCCIDWRLVRSHPLMGICF